jgi:hypothetical protein
MKGSGVLGGDFGGSEFTLSIGAEGAIDADSAKGLSIGTGTSAIANAGTIECTGKGGIAVDSPIDNSGVMRASRGVFTVGTSSEPESIVNTGTLEVSKSGTLIAYGAVTGQGIARIGGGTLEFASSFDEAVTFTGAGGTLALAQSQAYANTITGFSTTGATSLDLGDIGFVSPGEASFSGTAASGVLTVTDGTHTGSLTLEGDYLAATFVASSDGPGGTEVVAQAAARPAHALVSAMAGLAPSPSPAFERAGIAAPAAHAWLLAPRTALA